MKGQIFFSKANGNNSWNQTSTHTETQREAVLLKNSYVHVLFLSQGQIIEVLAFGLTLLMVLFSTMNKVFYRGASKWV